MFSKLYANLYEVFFNFLEQSSGSPWNADLGEWGIKQSKQF